MGKNRGGQSQRFVGKLPKPFSKQTGTARPTATGAGRTPVTQPGRETEHSSTDISSGPHRHSASGAPRTQNSSGPPPNTAVNTSSARASALPDLSWHPCESFLARRSLGAEFQTTDRQHWDPRSGTPHVLENPKTAGTTTGTPQGLGHQNTQVEFWRFR